MIDQKVSSTPGTAAIFCAVALASFKSRLFKSKQKMFKMGGGVFTGEGSGSECGPPLQMIKNKNTL